LGSGIILKLFIWLRCVALSWCYESCVLQGAAQCIFFNFKKTPSLLLDGYKNGFILFFFFATSKGSSCCRLLGSNGLSSNGSNWLAEILGDGLSDGGLLLGLKNADNIRKVVLGAGSASGVIVEHDLDLDTKDTLTKKDVTNSSLDEVASGLTRVDHETIGELHRLGTSSTELARDNNLASLGTRLHDEAKDTVAGTAQSKQKIRQFSWLQSRSYLPNSVFAKYLPTNSQSVEKLELDGLALSNSAETTVLDTLSVELNSVLGELETLLDERGQLANAATLLSENVLGVGGTDDDSEVQSRKVSKIFLPLRDRNPPSL
jgi:hypothetical protein